MSDVVRSRPLGAELTKVLALWTGCIAGALVEKDATSSRSGTGARPARATPCGDRMPLGYGTPDLPDERARGR
jgi:hypothetical protein